MIRVISRRRYNKKKETIRRSPVHLLGQEGIRVDIGKVRVEIIHSRSGLTVLVCLQVVDWDRRLILGDPSNYDVLTN